jgi:hypothetical protein
MGDGSNMASTFNPRAHGATQQLVTYASWRVWNEAAFDYFDLSGVVNMTPDEARATHDGQMVIVRNVRSF